MNELLKYYKQIEPLINKKLEIFAITRQLQDEYHILSELLFCLCTPQSKARRCWEAVKNLRDDLILNNKKNISEILKKNGVRFHNNKCGYLLEACEKFPEIMKKLKALRHEARNYLVENVRGLGMKEASHFLRNIGFYDEVCILDRHILRKLLEFKVIDKIPQVLTQKTYLAIEDKMKAFAKSVGLEIGAIDFVFWHQATGDIFK